MSDASPRKRVLITGATSGIGLELARRFETDAALLLTGRKPAAEAGPLLPEGADYVKADQADPETAARAITDRIDALGWAGVDLVILNAATGFAGDPAAEPAERTRQNLDINTVTPILIAHRLFPLLEAAGGKLVLVGSVAHRGAAGFASYAASKAALHGFGRALAEEWRGRVAVQVIHPGPTASGMHQKAGYDPGKAERWFIATDRMTSMITRAMAGDKPAVTASYGRFLRSGLWFGGSK